MLRCKWRVGATIKEVDWHENFYIWILRAQPRADCGNVGDSPNAWLLGVFLLAEVLILSTGYLKDTVICIFSGILITKWLTYNKSLSDEFWFLCSTFLVGSSKWILNLMPFGLTEFQMLLPEIRFAIILLFEQDTRRNSSEFSFFLIYSCTLWCYYPTPHTLYVSVGSAKFYLKRTCKDSHCCIKDSVAWQPMIGSPWYLGVLWPGMTFTRATQKFPSLERTQPRCYPFLLKPRILWNFHWNTKKARGLPK